jgi:uncharacterized metal-binding protein YceD (DUF177 family)
MSEVMPEFSRLVALGQLNSEPFRQQIEAAADERERLALRFDLVALDRLAATVTLRRQAGQGVLLEAELEAEFAQSCVVTLEPVSAAIQRSFSLLYGPADEDRTELDLAADETVFEPLTGDAIDIGEAVAQELSLALPESRAIPKRRSMTLQRRNRNRGRLCSPRWRGCAGRRGIDALAAYRRRDRGRRCCVVAAAVFFG